MSSKAIAIMTMAVIEPIQINAFLFTSSTFGLLFSGAGLRFAALIVNQPFI